MIDAHGQGTAKAEPWQYRREGLMFALELIEKENERKMQLIRKIRTPQYDQ